MTMTMIEQVARALCLDDGIVPDHADCHGWYEWEYYRDNAIAAITAMREPTDQMVDNGQDARLDGGGYYDVWRAMIDTALEEGE